MFPTLLKNPSVTAWLVSLPSFFSFDDGLRLWVQLADESIKGVFDDLWTHLQQDGIIISQGDDSPSMKRFQLWQKYDWSEAFVYHESTRNYPFIKMDEKGAFAEDTERMQAYVAEEPPPSRYQRFENPLLSIPLVKHDNDIALENYVSSLNREEKIGSKGVSVLFDICFGERFQSSFGCQGQFLKKTIPSGGARHPLEVFYFSFGKIVPSGVYHYNVRNNTLDQLRAENTYNEAEQATFDLFKKYNDKPLGLLVFTAIPERAMWRYRDSRSYRAILIDIGHALSALRIVSLKLGYRHYTYQKFDDKKIASLIGINPIHQIPFFVSSLVEGEG